MMIVSVPSKRATNGDNSSILSTLPGRIPVITAAKTVNNNSAYRKNTAKTKPTDLNQTDFEALIFKETLRSI